MRRTKQEVEDDRALDAAVAQSLELQKGPEYKAARAAELAALCRAWREKSGMPASRAAQLLGIPRRTYEGIEQGRGFPYPIMLTLALKAFD